VKVILSMEQAMVIIGYGGINAGSDRPLFSFHQDEH